MNLLPQQVKEKKFKYQCSHLWDGFGWVSKGNGKEGVARTVKSSMRRLLQAMGSGESAPGLTARQGLSLRGWEAGASSGHTVLGIIQQHSSPSPGRISP